MPRLTRGHVTGSLPAYDLTTEEVDLAIDRTRAWIADAKGVEQLPAELDDADWADAVEIAIMVVTNPEAFSQSTVGPTSRSWPVVMRRDAVIQRVRNRAQRGTSGPRGSYPPPPPYPEPASAYGAYGVWNAHFRIGP